MTTATDPPLIDEPTIGVDELPALDQPDERVCQMLASARPGGRTWPCPRSAAWVMSARCPTDGVESVLLCDECRSAASSALWIVWCSVCHRELAITWMERI